MMLEHVIKLTMHCIMNGQRSRRMTTESFEQRRDFQQCGILSSVDSDESVQPTFKVINSK